MIEVKARFFGTVRSLSGTKQQTLNLPQGSTIKDLLEELKKSTTPAFSQYIVVQGNTINPVLLMAINGKSLDEIDNLGCLLPDGALVDIMLVSPIAGG